MIRRIRALSRSRSRRRSGNEAESAPKPTVPTRILNDDSDDDISIDDYAFNSSVYDVDSTNASMFEFSSHGHSSLGTSKFSSSGNRPVPIPPSPSAMSQSYNDANHASGRGREEKNDKNRRRSTSKGTSVAATHASESRKDSNRKRSKSANRSQSVSRISENALNHVSLESSRGRSKSREIALHAEISKSHDSSDFNSDGKKRKSKMEKIVQLQEKNQRYKEEFRRVQKDRKALKKEIDARKEEVASLTKEIDRHISETTLLKQKLSETTQKLDSASHSSDADRNVIAHLREDLRQANDDHRLAMNQIEQLDHNIDQLAQTILSKEDFIKDLEEQVRLQKDHIEGLQTENQKLAESDENRAATVKQVRELSSENDRLKTELNTTVQHASIMVKEREDAIADLLRENDELKRDMTFKVESSSEVSKEEFVQLKQELATALASLEEAQDRNLALEEELEMFVQKTEEMETEHLRLREDLEAWQEKASAAEQSASLVERTLQQAEQRAADAETKCFELEHRYKEEQIILENNHKAAIAAVEKAALDKAMSIAEAKTKTLPNPQEIMLQAAVAKKQATKGSWGIGGFLLSGPESDENMPADEKRIRELQMINSDQEEEIKKLKSELVRLRSTFNDTMYTNKKKVEILESENAAYVLKVQAFERELSLQSNCGSSYPELVSTSSNNSD